MCYLIEGSQRDLMEDTAWLSWE